MFYNMKIHLLLALCIVWIRSEKVHAVVENEVKRGTFPFMALLYYPDESIVDATGARFQRGAVLLSPQWLVSAAIDHSTMDNLPLGFPVKTLLARVGAITLDANYTLNEDEDEQEREVIQIARPSNHNVETWWFTDITLLKTLLPFPETPAIAPIVSPMNIHRINMNATDCKILVFAKKTKPSSDDKVLMQMTVDLLPPSADICGAQFTEKSMVCAFDSQETKNAKYDAEFCVGNAGGPLMCEGNVVGLQTYIENICKPPHLYQLLFSWEKMISCAMQEHCHADISCDICTVSYKDLPYTNDSTTSLPVTESRITTSEIVTTVTEESESVHASSPKLETTAFENETLTTQTEESAEEKTDHESSSPETTATEWTTEADTSVNTEVNETNASEIPTSSFDIITTTSVEIDESTTTTTSTTTVPQTATTTTTQSNIMYVPPKVNHTMKKTMFFSKYRGESDTEEDASRKMKVEVEAQQKPISSAKAALSQSVGSNSRSLMSSRCVLIYLSLLSYFVN